MHTIASTALRRMTGEEIKAILPVIVTWNEIPLYIAGGLDNTIVMDDLSLPVRRQLKAKEALARSGMPKPERIYTSDVYMRPDKNPPDAAEE